MIRTKEDLQRVNTEILEKYFIDYRKLKKDIESVIGKDKQTLQYKNKIVEGIDEIYPTLTDEMKVIIQQRYWYKDYQSEWADIADELGTTVSRVKRLRDVIIRLFSEAIGWV